ncbi:DUF2971 domain-containing protein [Nocardioides guangzhouensis]|uniref:DUF2971 domain-containing protein n=1 Tax=Nocardioides guangzhouensis TaxID=2497878 RepID=A0A4Q4Z9R3_9ACTN|nr:DUF2971 domain-containing protein [Nocardioides guangzhouensis]RYP84613.1 DUF2971 domain-containing protein [Nocardioides guangzhouensis]
MANEDSNENPGSRARLIEELMVAFSQDQSDNYSNWLSRQAQVPKRLYHYTTIDGLMGIVGANALWASDVRFMNDSSELSYAVDLVDDVVEERIANVSDETLKNALPTRRGFTDTFEYGRRPFVACFCEEEDLLSQWRGYGTGQAGVSLGFDLRVMSMADRLPPRTFLRKVVYGREEQRSAVAAAVDAWLATAQTLLDKGAVDINELFPYPAIWALQEALAEQQLCFKHPTFREEQEWRLIKMVNVREELSLLSHLRTEATLRDADEQMQRLGMNMPPRPPASFFPQSDAEGLNLLFRKSALGLVPYVELPLQDQAGVFHGRLPLWEVRQGPTLNPGLAMESLSMFLESHGYGMHTDLSVSEIPLRP